MLTIGKVSRIAEFDVEWVGALSAEEYKAGKEFIPRLKESWWLRSPGYFSYLAASVDACGNIHANGSSIYYGSYAVRPALRIGNLESLNLRPGDKAEVAGVMWTVISENLALADEFIGESVFNKDLEKGNEYHGSDLEKYILTWWEKRSK